MTDYLITGCKRICKTIKLKKKVMENVKIRALSTCILIFVVVCNFIFSEGISWSKYTFWENNYRYTCVPKETIFESDKVLDPITCSKICNSNSDCRNFLYQPSDHKCIGCRDTGLEPRAENYQESPGAMFFKQREFDCQDILDLNRTAKSGIYEIKLPRSRSKLKVYCDMETDGGGWTVIHNRFDGSVDFYRSFTDYENGFGNAGGEYWLGLKYIQEIAERRAPFRQYLWLEMSTKNGDTRHEQYANFMLSGGTDYQLATSLYELNYRETPSWKKLMSAVGRPFSTKDRDMDLSAGNCAEELHGAGWYTSCGNVNLHGKYCKPGEPCDDGKNGTTGHYYQGFAGLESLKTSRMMLRQLINHIKQ